MCIHASLPETNAPATCLLWNYFLLWILTDWRVLQAKTDLCFLRAPPCSPVHIQLVNGTAARVSLSGFTASLSASTRENHSRSSLLRNPNERTDGKEMKRRRRSLYLSSPAERRRNNLLSSQRKREKANKRELKESLDRKQTGDGGRCWRCGASEWANQLRPFLTSVNCCISHSFSFKQPHCVTCNTD